MMEGDPSFSSEKVQRALAGQLLVEELTDPEARSFFAGLADSMLVPSDAVRAAYASLSEDAPGIDEAALYGAPPPGSGGPAIDQAVGAGPIAAVIAMAINVWKRPDRAVAWLRRPHPLLDGRPPLLVAATEDGARQVVGLLGRLRHGTAS